MAGLGLSSGHPNGPLRWPPGCSGGQSRRSCSPLAPFPLLHLPLSVRDCRRLVTGVLSLPSLSFESQIKQTQTTETAQKEKAEFQPFRAECTCPWNSSVKGLLTSPPFSKDTIKGEIRAQRSSLQSREGHEFTQPHTLGATPRADSGSRASGSGDTARAPGAAAHTRVGAPTVRPSSHCALGFSSRRRGAVATLRES